MSFVPSLWMDGSFWRNKAIFDFPVLLVTEYPDVRPSRRRVYTFALLLLSTKWLRVNGVSASEVLREDYRAVLVPQWYESVPPTNLLTRLISAALICSVSLNYNEVTDSLRKTVNCVRSAISSSITLYLSCHLVVDTDVLYIGIV